MPSADSAIFRPKKMTPLRENDLNSFCSDEQNVYRNFITDNLTVFYTLVFVDMLNDTFALYRKLERKKKYERHPKVRECVNII